MIAAPTRWVAPQCFLGSFAILRVFDVVGRTCLRSWREACRNAATLTGGYSRLGAVKVRSEPFKPSSFRIQFNWRSFPIPLNPFFNLRLRAQLVNRTTLVLRNTSSRCGPKHISNTGESCRTPEKRKPQSKHPE